MFWVATRFQWIFCLAGQALDQKMSSDIKVSVQRCGSPNGICHSIDGLWVHSEDLLEPHLELTETKYNMSAEGSLPLQHFGSAGRDCGGQVYYRGTAQT